MARYPRKDIERLRSYLRGELAAVETYDRAIRALDELSPLRECLSEPRASHVRRVELLSRRIVALGGEADETSGPWGRIVDALQLLTEVFGTDALLNALCMNERHNTRDYERDMDRASLLLQNLLVNVLLPEQRWSERLALQTRSDLARESFAA